MLARLGPRSGRVRSSDQVFRIVTFVEKEVKAPPLHNPCRADRATVHTIFRSFGRLDAGREAQSTRRQ